MPHRLTRRFRALLATVLMMAPLLCAGRAGAAISGFQVSPVHFSPNGDGLFDQVRLTWALSDSASDLRILVRTGSSLAVVRTIALGARPAGIDSAQWDGRNDAAVVLPDTNYTLSLVETPANGSGVVSAVVGVVLDNTAPPVPTIDGATDTTQTLAVRTVSGNAPGADSVYVFRDGVRFAVVATTLGVQGAIFEVQNIPIPLGATQFAAQSRDLAGNFSALSTPVTIRFVNQPDLQFVRPVASASSPNGDGVLDTVKVRVQFDAPAPRVRVDVRSGTLPSGTSPGDSSKPVAHLYDGPVPADSLFLTWDVRDSVGNPMPDGFYIVRAEAPVFDAQGDSENTVQADAQFRIDRVPPGTPTPVPLPAPTTFRNFVILAGFSAGAESVTVFHDGAPLGEVGTEAFSFGVGLHLGVNTVAVIARDEAGNASATAGPYTIDYETPVGFHANERFRANDAFVFNLDKAANAIDVALYTLRGRHVRTLHSRDVQLHYDIPWDGLDERGDFAGDGPYVAIATVTFVDGTHTEAKGAVVLVK